MLPTTPLDPAALLKSLFPDIDVGLLLQAATLQQQSGISSNFPTALPGVSGVNLAGLPSGTKHDGFMDPSNRFMIPPGSYAPAVVWASMTGSPGTEDVGEVGKKVVEPPKIEEDDDFHFEMGKIGKENYFPAHFMRGTLISVGNGREKTVDQLSSDDFLMSSALSTSLNMETCAVVEISQVNECSRITFMVPSKGKEVLLEVQNEYPFFALGKGWTSCDPRGTLKTFGLSTETLKIGDICITLIMDEKLKGTIGTASVPDVILDRKRVIPQITEIEDGRPASAPPLGHSTSVRTRTWSGSTPCPHLT